MTTADTDENSRMDRKRKISTSRSDGNSYHYKQSHQRTNNPRRGGPGILFTCETGREFKARREGLEILKQDWLQPQQTPSTPHVSNSDSTAPLTGKDGSIKSTLEEELAQLHKDRSKSHLPSPDAPFALYETGCKGVVVFLFQRSVVQNSISPASTTTVSSVEVNILNDFSGNPGSTSGVDEDDPLVDTFDANNATVSDLWDPILAVQRIAHDMTETSPLYTSSRFITRMIPIQMTCYATIDDIVPAVQTLLQRILTLEISPPSPTSGACSGASKPLTASHTFAIHEKRRFCSHLKREPLITAVGNMVGTITKENPWTVDLTNPDFTIWIEICKTLAGVSILPAKHLHPRNFNMVEWRLSVDQNTECVNAKENETCQPSAVSGASCVEQKNVVSVDVASIDKA